MKNLYLIIILATVCVACKKNEVKTIAYLSSQEVEKTPKRTKVLTFGTFHFKFPNLDVAKIDETNQIDVLNPKYQEEIIEIVNKLLEFKPTKIVIERRPEKQKEYDSLYNSYLNDEHLLDRSEEQQIGFRLAKKLGLNKLHCTDSWGKSYEDVKKVTNGNDSISKAKFLDYFYNNPDSTLFSFYNEKSLFKTKGITEELKRINSKKYTKNSLGDYLIGIFKYETESNKQLGPDYVTTWWFNRNLRIFRNIQRIETDADDRILVIYGAGHMNLLNIFFDSSPEYELINLNEYL